MKVKHIQTKVFESNESQKQSTKLIESNESQTHLNNAFWIKWKSNTFKQRILNQMKLKHIYTKLLESNESQMHSTS